MNRMIKKTGILFGVFAAALLICFFLNRRWSGESEAVYVNMGEAALPVVSVEMFGRKMNPMAGYCQEMEGPSVGESLTILPDNRQLPVDIDLAADGILGIRYEIRSMDQERLVERTTVEDWSATEQGLRAVLPIQNLLTMEREYLLRLELITEAHGSVYYYTRILWTEGTTAQPMIDLAAEFSEKTYDYEQARELVTYLETSPSEDNSSFGSTSIRSSFSQLTWGKLKLQPEGEPQVTLKELDGIMCSVGVSRMAVRQTEDDRSERYEVQEAFTMKWNEQRTYMMDYSRQADQIFEGSKSEFSGKRIMLGITNDDQVEAVKSPSGKLTAYRVNRELWSYNEPERQAVRIFSFRGNDQADMRNNYSRHNIRILSAADNGDVNFLVYGYMNRGNHEGHMGIVGYHYDAQESLLEELYYIPWTRSYEELAEDLDKLVYQTEGGMLYLYVDRAIYGIDLRSRENIVVADALTDGSYAVSSDRRRIAWQDGGELYGAKTLHLMDLDTGEKLEISGAPDEYVRVLGFVGRDLVYGKAGETDLWVINGRIADLPMNTICIINDRMEEETRYERQGCHIAGVRVEDSRVHLNQVIRVSEGQFVPDREDTIVCNADVSSGKLEGIGWYASQDKGKLYFVQLGSDVKGRVRFSAPKNVSCEQSDELDLKSNYEVQGMEFYAWGGGRLLTVTMNFTEALQAAYDSMGFVTDSFHRILWDRVNRGGLRALQRPEALFAPVQRHLEEFAGSRMYGDGYAVLDARGCSMQQMLYFIDQGIPVMAYTGQGEYLLLCGYDQYNVTVYNPRSGETWKMGLNDSTEYFKNAGNDFICAIFVQ
ncbi:MAG: hypothetical protein Q4C73_10055 [Eubacteriales bacterium]|nr:hypothetical protein [Eubacteriales bacterium]